MTRKKEYLLRIDTALFQELQAWASDDLRSVNGQIEFLLRQAVAQRRRRLVPPSDEGNDASEDGTG
jgi:Uncharacterized protein conserved in bacteria